MFPLTISVPSTLVYMLSIIVDDWEVILVGFLFSCRKTETFYLSMLAKPTLDFFIFSKGVSNKQNSGK